MKRDKSDEETQFWVCNISDRNVTLSDLRVSIPARKGINLLDSKHYKYSYEQLKLSMTSGSIYKKRDKIKIGKGPPQVVPVGQRTISKRPLVRRSRTCVKIEEKTEFDDEFSFSDEEYAAAMSKEFGEL